MRHRNQGRGRRRRRSHDFQQGPRPQHGHPQGNPHGGQHGRPSQAPPRPQIPSVEVDRYYANKTAVAPHEWIRLEKGSDDVSMRAIDLLAPIGKGQRGLIVSPPKAGKTTLLKTLCQAICQSDPSIQVYVLLVDERPEEVTDFRRSVPAEVFASSNDKPFEEHVRVSNQVFQKAVEQAAAGKDVLILLDSLTRLARVHNARSTGNRTMTGGLDTRAMEIPRRMFGAARKLEEGGSLTILASILVQTGSRMDDIIFQEFKGTGNMDLVLSRPAAEQRIFPAIDIRASGTRKEEALLPADMLERIWKLRRAFATLPDLEATRRMVALLKQHRTNDQLLGTIG